MTKNHSDRPTDTLNQRTVPCTFAETTIEKVIIPVSVETPKETIKEKID